MSTVANVNDLLDGHVILDLDCLDRIYLNAYVPNLQTPGQVVGFMRDHLKMPIASPAIVEKIGNRFRDAVAHFAETNDIPVIRFQKQDRHVDVAQEFQSVFASSRRDTIDGAPFFTFYKADRRVTAYYFYVMDAEFGPGFIKICSYFPYPGKVWVNGHEWAKRQAHKAGLSFTELSNGFSTCIDPGRLQSICDRLGPAQILSFFERWMSVVPTPLASKDRQAGYWWELSMRQVEVSKTIVFDAPRRARAFFEATVADNLDIGRPDEVKLVFARQIRKNTPGEFATKVVTRGTQVTVNAFYRHSRIKQYLKEGRALRIETVVNSPADFRVPRRIHHLAELVDKAKEANRRLALRFGEPRAMALAGALCVALNTVVGFTNKSLCALVSQLLDGPYSASQMTYDLRRLRLKGLVARVPRTNTYVLTNDGIRFAVTYTKLGRRLLPPLLAANQPPAPPPLRQAFRVIEGHVERYLDQARLRPAA